MWSWPPIFTGSRSLRFGTLVCVVPGTRVIGIECRPRSECNRILLQISLPHIECSLNAVWPSLQGWPPSDSGSSCCPSYSHNAPQFVDKVAFKGCHHGSEEKRILGHVSDDHHLVIDWWNSVWRYIRAFFQVFTSLLFTPCHFYIWTVKWEEKTHQLLVQRSYFSIIHVILAYIDCSFIVEVKVKDYGKGRLLPNSLASSLCRCWSSFSTFCLHITSFFRSCVSEKARFHHPHRPVCSR